MQTLTLSTSLRWRLLHVVCTCCGRGPLALQVLWNMRSLLRMPTTTGERSLLKQQIWKFVAWRNLQTTLFHWMQPATWQSQIQLLWHMLQLQVRVCGACWAECIYVYISKPLIIVQTFNTKELRTYSWFCIILHNYVARQYKIRHTHCFYADMYVQKYIIRM